MPFARPRRGATRKAGAAAGVDPRIAAAGGVDPRIADPVLRRRFGAEALREGARRRATELFGLALGALALAWLAALLTYHASDPSPDTASSGPVRNLLGHAGAWFADQSLQWLGLAAVMPALALLAWCWRIASHRGLGNPLLRLTATVLLVPAVAVVFEGFGAAPAAWPTASGPGGEIGAWLSGELLGMGRSLGGTGGAIGAWALAGLLAALLLVLSFGLSFGEWRAAGRGAQRAAIVSAASSRRLVSWLQRRQGTVPAVADGPRGWEEIAREEQFHHPDPVEPARREPMSAPPRERSVRRGRIEIPDTTRVTPGTRYVMPPGLTDLPDDVGEDYARRAPARETLPALAGPVAVAERPQARARTADPSAPPPGTVGGAVLAPPPAEESGMLRRLLGNRGGENGREPPRPTPPSTPPGAPPGRTPRSPAGAPSHWQLPSLSLLAAAPRPGDAGRDPGPSEAALQANARLLETVLADYGVMGTIGDIHTGPVVTLYELIPAPGIRSARVIGLADDIARSLCVTAVRIATVPGRNVIGIEVPNAKRETVLFSELLSGGEWYSTPSRLCLALGKDISGAPIYADLARMPHLLIAGTTGSGKSVGVNAMILSLLYRLSPDECRLILIDPKMLELSIYDGIPHLMAPVVTEPAKAVTALKWTVREMERRYRLMSQLGVRNIGGFNERAASARATGETLARRVQTGFDPETGRPIFEEQALSLENLPYIVVVIDEMADLMMVAGKEIEQAVQRLAQMARAAGIHVIAATQRPSVDVITGTIKANFPTRISFQVISKFDSRTILGEQGAEQLLGAGDMLYMAGGGRITRIHGPFVDDKEVERVVGFLRSQGEPAYLDDVTASLEDEGSGSSGGGGGNGGDDVNLLDQAIALVAREGKASTSFIQRHLSIGYNRAAKLIEQMEKEGVVGPANHVGKREILVRRDRDLD
ncbi:S-DNA-T family DNA segregation ATPase FtsK/SpoIIIE [Endobacter medicaginis]|uniref:DNA translocase FtsK n=2 Tax=Endobacter medicaginis TaxID=1181271 RepID=A0A839V237_9PROT|nr:DNA translocase FtsK [Endobacter medicaginis]MBB3174803.1 S-DNA-T family DNA segregation ATPase FtsK/SpoIIIE [Endobacter medicaginis]MCX5476002.1 DNA translocase FtsK 4TM domain-containing protein [Endobacter medicaginis]